jgi:NAD-dependent SIR2 family protein deacetylase
VVTGLYDNLAKYELPKPTAVFDLDFFRENPKPFFQLARELYPGRFKPTITHYFLKLLADKGLLRRVYTQNIDTLERMAGVPSDLLVEAHGSFGSATCRVCGRKFGSEYVASKLFQVGIEGDEVVIPRCDDERCGGVVKPDIVFFGVSTSW